MRQDRQSLFPTYANVDGHWQLITDRYETEINKIWNGILRDAVSYTDVLTRRSILSKSRTVSPHRRNVISFASTRKAQPFLCLLLRNSQILKSTRCRSLVPNFTQIGQCTWKVWAKIHLHPLLFFHCTNFHETQNALNKLWTSSVQNFIYTGTKI
jgi:hypothetical protein